MDSADVVEINQVLGLYGQIVDTGDWDALHRVFTDEAIFDITDFGMGSVEGLAEIRSMFEKSDRPYSVHIVNVVVSGLDQPGAARAYSKNLGLLPKGRIGSAAYDDVLVKTVNGWRVSRRVATLRRER
jgi:hypothetical protein